MILGAILAGGRSSRFGSDKAEALLDGRALIDHAADTLRPHVAAIALSGRTRPGWEHVDDRPKPGLGPLGGIAGALHFAAKQGYDSVLTVACDMPIVPAELIAALVENCPAYCGDAPILGHWPVSAVAALEDRLSFAAAESGDTPLANRKNSGLSIRRWASDIGAAVVLSAGPLANINTPADLATL